MMFTPQEKWDKSFIEESGKTLQSKLQFLADSLGENEYFCDNHFTVVDIQLGYVLSLCNQLKQLEQFPTLKKYVERLASRDAFKRAHGPEESNEVRSLRESVHKLKAEKEEKLTASLASSNKLTLYHFAGTRSTRCAWLLNELEVDYTFFDLSKKGITWIKSDEYTQINPNGTIPALLEGDKKYFEAGAIMKLICLKYPKAVEAKGLLPIHSWTDENWERHDKYAFWTIATMDQRLLTLTQFVTAVVGSTLTKSLLISSGTKTWLQECFRLIAADLGTQDYLQGNAFTLTDIYLGFTLAHAFHGGLLSNAPSTIQAYYSRINKRPAFRKAVEGALFTFYNPKE